MISRADAAQILCCSVETLESEMANGNLPSVKIGRERVIPREAFIQRVNELALEEAKKLRRPSTVPAPIKRRRPLPAIPPENS